MAGAFVDKEITCVDCGQPFTHTAGQQEHFAKLGFTNEPKRCPTCRAAKKASSGGGGGAPRGGRGPSGPREMHTAVCSECGGPAQVPFKPRGDKPVYCSSCFSTKR